MRGGLRAGIAVAVAFAVTACSFALGEGEFVGGADPDAASSSSGGDASNALDTGVVPPASDASDGGGEDGDASPPEVDLIGWWKLDDGAGTSAKDSSRYGNHGTLGGATAFTTSGRLAGAATFDGIGPGITIPKHPSMTLSTTMTIAFWLRFDDAAQDNPRIFGFAGAFSVKLNGGTKPQLTASGLYSQTLTQVAAGQWHHVAFTFDSGVVAAYYDGFALTDLSGTMVAGTTLVPDGTTVTIGTDSPGTFPFKGSVDDVRLYRRVLSATEITTLAK